MIARSVAAVLAISLAGCSSVPAVVDGFEGPARDDQAVAVLFTPDAASLPETHRPARLAAIDGRVYGDYLHGYPWVTRALPGTVVLKLNCPQPLLADDQSRLIRVPIEAGHYYELVCHDFRAEAVDCGTDQAAVKDLLPAAVAGRSILSSNHGDTNR